MSYCNYKAVHQVLDLLPTIKAEGLGASAFYTLLGLAKRTDKQGRCWPSLETIVDDTFYSQSTVSRSLKKLEAKRYLQITHSKQGSKQSNHYQLLLDSHVTVTGHPETVISQSAVLTSQDDNPSPVTVLEVISQSAVLTSQDDSLTTTTTTTATNTSSINQSIITANPDARERGNEAIACLVVLGEEQENVERQTVAQETIAQAPRQVISPAAEKLAYLFFEKEGKLDEHQPYLSAWGSAFDDLLKTYTEKELQSCLDWSFADKFWSEKLARPRNPLEYFLSVLKPYKNKHGQPEAGLMSRSKSHKASLLNRSVRSLDDKQIKTMDYSDSF